MAISCSRLCIAIAPFLLVIGCGDHKTDSVPPVGSGGSATCHAARVPALTINELSTSNDGNAVDEYGNADDWIEIVNVGSTPEALGGLTLSAAGKTAGLPAITLASGERIVLWADGTPNQGQLHLPLRLPASGTHVSLELCDRVVSAVDVPPLESNLTFARFPDQTGAFVPCRYASVGRANGPSCGPSQPTLPPESVQFSEYSWSLPHPTLPSPLTIEELALNPAEFIEVRNVSSEPVSLADYQLQIATIRPGIAWPSAADGTLLSFDSTRVLTPGERTTVVVSSGQIPQLSDSPQFEGVVSLVRVDGEVIDRVDFAHWPKDAVLARLDQYASHHVFCRPATAGSPNDACTILNEREVGDYVRHQRTLGDFEQLSAGSGELGMASVKFILDMQAGNQIYLVGARDWSLHYEFIREVVYGQPHLDRCDPVQRAQFDDGWYRFSVSEYFQTTGRRFLLGTLVHHAASDLYTVEFTNGDAILPEDMRKAFFAVTSHVLRPQSFHLRPQDEDQTAHALSLNGTLPIVAENTPFTTTKLQPLTAAVGYGVLTYVPTAELDQATLGRDVIVITDDVPNDIPLVGGLITEAFQTPLSHVNVLCQNRGTPNLALPFAHTHPEFAPLLGQLVRFEVTSDGYRLTPAAADEAQAFWDANRPSLSRLSPRLDLERNTVVDLETASLEDLPSIGAKAAQLAELLKLSKTYVPNCTSATHFTVPQPAVAIPMRYFVEHSQTSGARALLETLVNTPDLHTNRELRHQQLDEIRRVIRSTPISASALADWSQVFRERFGTTRLRLRSSSNAEDLPGFNGAGLYASTSATLDDEPSSLQDGVREVWASMYSDRGYDERAEYNVDQRQVAMAVLVHPAFPEERANAVVISRNLEDLTRGDMYTFNAQVGEASVTNPAPGVISDQFTYQWPPRLPELSFRSHSSFNEGSPVLSQSEVRSAACALNAIVRHFRPLLDPEERDAYFTMDMEMKLVGQQRELLIKQARPYTLGAWRNPGDCREF